MIPSRCLDGSISVSGYICVNDNKNALFVLYNNVTSIVKYFSVISAPLDLWLHEVQFQLVPKFSQVFFVSTHLWVFAKHLMNFYQQVHHFLAKIGQFWKIAICQNSLFFISFEFCTNLSWILPKFLTSLSSILAKFAIFAKSEMVAKIANSQPVSFVISVEFMPSFNELLPNLRLLL